MKRNIDKDKSIDGNHRRLSHSNIHTVYIFHGFLFWKIWKFVTQPEAKHYIQCCIKAYLNTILFHVLAADPSESQKSNFLLLSMYSVWRLSVSNVTIFSPISYPLHQCIMAEFSLNYFTYPTTSVISKIFGLTNGKKEYFLGEKTSWSSTLFNRF